RVADAVDAAGGALPEADLSQLNLARRLADGELVAVGVPPPPDEVGGRAGAPAKVNLNTATQTDLETLPGIGPALAQRILAWREVNGGFSSVDQLREISGIGEVRFAELRELVTVCRWPGRQPRAGVPPTCASRRPRAPPGWRPSPPCTPA